MKNFLLTSLFILITGLLFGQNDDAKRAYNKGLALYQQNSFEQAIPLLTEAIMYFESFEAAHQLLAICYDETNQLDKSISHYEQVIVLNPSDKKAMFNLSKQYQRNKDFDSAKAILNKALTIDPTYLKAKNELVQIDKIVEGVGKKEDASYYKANGLYKQKKYNEAIQVLVPLNERNPSSNSLYLEGICQEKMGDLNEAATRFQGATVLDSNYIDAYIGMGIIRYNQQNYQEAIEHFKSVIQLENEPSEEFAYYLGNCYYRVGDYIEAFGYLNDAVLLDPNSGRAHYTLYKAYEKIGKEDKSIIHRIRAEELGYDGRYEDSQTKSTTTTTTTETTEETTVTITKRRGPGGKGIVVETIEEIETKLSKKEQKALEKQAEIEQKEREVKERELELKKKKEELDNQAELDRKAKEIKEREIELKKKEKELKKQAELDRKEREVKAQEIELKKKEEALDKQEELDRKEQEVKARELELKKKKEAIEKQAALERKEREIKEREAAEQIKIAEEKEREIELKIKEQEELDKQAETEETEQERAIRELEETLKNLEKAREIELEIELRKIELEKQKDIQQEEKTIEESETTLSTEEEQEDPKKQSKSEKKNKEKAEKELRKKQKKNPTYRGNFSND